MGVGLGASSCQALLRGSGIPSAGDVGLLSGGPAAAQGGDGGLRGLPMLDQPPGKCQWIRISRGAYLHHSQFATGPHRQPAATHAVAQRGAPSLTMAGSGRRSKGVGVGASPAPSNAYCTGASGSACSRALTPPPYPKGFPCCLAAQPPSPQGPSLSTVAKGPRLAFPTGALQGWSIALSQGRPWGRGGVPPHATPCREEGASHQSGGRGWGR